MAFDITSLMSIDSAINWTSYIFYGCLLLIAGFIGYFFIIRPAMSPFRITVFRHRGGTSLSLLDTYGYISKKDGIDHLNIKGFENTLPRPQGDDIFASRKKQKVFIYEDVNRELHYVNFRFTDEIDEETGQPISMRFMTPDPSNWKEWHVTATKAAYLKYEKKKTDLQLLLTWIVPVVLVLVIGIVFYMLAAPLKEMAGTVGDAATRVATALAGGRP